MTSGVLELRVEGSERKLVPGEFFADLKGDNDGMQNAVFNGFSCTELESLPDDSTIDHCLWCARDFHFKRN